MTDLILKQIDLIASKMKEEVLQNASLFRGVDPDSVTLTLTYEFLTELVGVRGEGIGSNCMKCTPKGCKPC